MTYIVKELVAHRWYVVRSFDNAEDAESFAKWIGRKAKVVTRK